MFPWRSRAAVCLVVLAAGACGVGLVASAPASSQARTRASLSSSRAAGTGSRAVATRVSHRSRGSRVELVASRLKTRAATLVRRLDREHAARRGHGRLGRGVLAAARAHRSGRVPSPSAVRGCVRRSRAELRRSRTRGRGAAAAGPAPRVFASPAVVARVVRRCLADPGLRAAGMSTRGGAHR